MYNNKRFCYKSAEPGVYRMKNAYVNRVWEEVKAKNANEP